MTFQGVPPWWRGRCSQPRVWVIILRDTNSTGVSVLSFLPSGFVLSSYFWLERLAYRDCSFITSLYTNGKLQGKFRSCMNYLQKRDRFLIFCFWSLKQWTAKRFIFIFKLLKSSFKLIFITDKFQNDFNLNHYPREANHCARLVTSTM